MPPRNAGKSVLISIISTCKAFGDGHEQRDTTSLKSPFLLLRLAKALSYHLTVYRPTYSVDKHRVSAEREYVVLHVFKYVVSAKD